MIRSRKGNFLSLKAEDRFKLLCSADNPSGTLKKLCRSTEPGITFNQIGVNNTPRALLVGAFEPSDLPAGRFDCPPFGLQRIASFLRAGGVNSEIFPVTSLGKEKLLKKVSKTKYDLICFSTLGPTLPFDIQLTHEIRKIQPKTNLVVGGVAATTNPELLTDSAANCLIVGYGEEPLLNLIANKQAGKKVNGIPGLYLRNFPTNRFKGNKASIPTYEDLRIYSYLLDPKLGADLSYKNPGGLYPKMSKQRTKVYRFMSQAFCPKNCSFCSTRNFLKLATGKKTIPYLSLTPEDKFKVIKNISRQLPAIQTIFISDDDFFTSKISAGSFFKILIGARKQKQIRKIAFILSSRIDELDNPTLKLAHQAGVILINIGVESFSEKSLTALSKEVNKKNGLSVDKFINKTLSTIIHRKITPSINLLIFHPFADWDQIYQTVINTVDYLKRGGEANLTTYVKNYYGADILKDHSIPSSSYTEIVTKHSGKKLVFINKTFLLPKGKRIRNFSREVIQRRAKLEEELKSEYCWSYKRAPHKIVQLIFLRAICEEADKADFISGEQCKNQVLKVNKLIKREFARLKTKRETEKHHIYSVRSLSPLHQNEVLQLIEKMNKKSFTETQKRLILDLKTKPFCQLYEDSRFATVAPYLKYLFFAEDKGRFFHLDNIDRIVIVKGTIGNQNFTSTQKEFLCQALNADIKTKTELSDIRATLKLLNKNNIWAADKFASSVSQKIKPFLDTIINKLPK